MKKDSKINLRIVLFYFFLFIFSENIFSQQIVVLENADKIIGSEIQNQKFRELIGNVKLSQGNLKIYCDKALQNMAKNEYDLTGNVKITKGELKIISTIAHYDANQKIGFFKNGIEVYKEKFHVLANEGVFYNEQNLTEFKKNVKANDEVSKIDCDVLKYFEKDDSIIATENVFVRNYENDLIIKSQRMDHFQKKNFSKFTNNAVFIKIDTTENGELDTLIVKGDVLEIYNDSTEIMNAKGNVQLAQGSLSAICNNLNFEQKKEKITFTIKPCLWYEKSQITGDTIIATLDKNKIKDLEIKRKAFMISQHDSTLSDKYDQMTGKNIKMLFDDKELSKILINGNAISLYFLIEDGKSKGANKTSGDKIDLLFSDGSLSKIIIKKEVEGKYYPEKMIRRNPAEINLEGFKIIENRPSVKNILGTTF